MAQVIVDLVIGAAALFAVYRVIYVGLALFSGRFCAWHIKRTR